MLLHIRWVQAKEAEAEADSALNQATSIVAEKAQMQMEAAKAQAIASLKLPELREGEARAAAALQRLQIAKTQLEEDANRILRRRDELTRRLAQLAEDITREERLVADNAEILARLDAEEAEINEILADSGRYAEETREAFEEAAAKLADSERIFTGLTAERAEAPPAATSWNAPSAISPIARCVLSGRWTRPTASCRRSARRIATLPDPDEKREVVEAGESAVAEAEATIQAVEQALAAARQTEAMSRAPVDQARSQLNAIETESRTISRMLAAGATAGEFSPLPTICASIAASKPRWVLPLATIWNRRSIRRRPAHWSENGDGAADPKLPDGVTPLLDHVRAPAALTRRLKQIGLVSDADAPRLMPALKPGQRLVTRDGAVYRWDGHVTGADAPSAAALRLAQKKPPVGARKRSRARPRRACRSRGTAGVAAEAISGEEQRLAAARDVSRMSGRHLAEAREALAAAERASGDLIRRRDVIAEAVSQLQSQLEDIAIQEENARIELEDAPDLTAIDEKLRLQQADVATDRGALAEARARHESLNRENDARQRRIIAIGQERGTWRQRAASAEDHIATLRDREEEARDEAADLEMAPDEFDDKRRGLLNELQKADDARRAAADLLAQAELVQRDVDHKATMRCRNWPKAANAAAAPKSGSFLPARSGWKAKPASARR
jgi:chromosome segregation protein